jgi:hypothetical protein
MKIRHKLINSGTLNVSKDIHESGKLVIDENGTIELADDKANLLLEHPDFELAEETPPVETAKQKKAREAKEAKEKEAENTNENKD